MGIFDFEGNTYAAYVDISGFKNMMKDENRIKKVVYEFYKIGYKTLKKYNNKAQSNQSKLQGIFVSDCGIIFVNKHHSDEFPDRFEDLNSYHNSLNLLLDVIREINAYMIKINVMLTTSIAYGKLNCVEKIQFKGISKSPIYGDAYLTAFLDHEDPRLKIQPGECRIVAKDLPIKLITKENKSDYQNFKLLKKKGVYYYFYWMLVEDNKIEEYNEKYKNLKNELYTKMAELIKNYAKFLLL